MSDTVRSTDPDTQRAPSLRENLQRTDKIKLLKEHLAEKAAGHRKRMTEIKTQNMNRLNNIRRFIDEATNKTPTNARGRRKSEPMSPTSSVTGTNEEIQESARSPPKAGALEIASNNDIERKVQDDLASSTKFSEQNEIYLSSALEVAAKKAGSETLSKKAGNLAITVLKHFYSSDGCCPKKEEKTVDRSRKPRELQTRLDEANKAKQKAEERVISLEEQIEDLNIELKGLSNELKDTRRSYEERLHSYEKKYNTRIKAVERQVEDGGILKPMSTWKLKSSVSQGLSDLQKSGSDEPKLLNNRSNKKVSTQFDQVISSLLLTDNSNGERDEDKEVEDKDESELIRLNGRVTELQSELEELNSKYTKEKSQRLHVMWCLEAKSRQVQNLLAIQEEHSQLLVQHSQLIAENNLLRERLVSFGVNPNDFSSDLIYNNQNLESKYTLLQTAEIKRLRNVLQRATEMHPDLEEYKTPSPDSLVISRISPFGTPNRRYNPSLQKKEHLRSKTIAVVDRNNPKEIVTTSSNVDTIPTEKDSELPAPAPPRPVENNEDETLGFFSDTSFKPKRVGLKPYFVYTLHGSEIPVEELQDLAEEATADKLSSSPIESPDLQPS